MSKLRSPWLDQDARTLVRRAATIERAPAGAKARVLGRVEAIVASPDGVDRRDTSRPPSGPLFPGGTRALAIAAAFALGGGLGALVMDRVAHPPLALEAAPAPSIEHDVPTATVELRPSLLAIPSANTTGPATPLARERPAAAGTGSSLRTSSGKTADPVSDERTLLDEARVAVEREDGAAALTATDEHARKFPRGVFVQEREAIAVRALVLLGRTDEARARVDRFRERFPDSLLLPALESSAGIQPTP